MSQYKNQNQSTKNQTNLEAAAYAAEEAEAAATSPALVAEA